MLVHTACHTHARGAWCKADLEHVEQRSPEKGIPEQELDEGLDGARAHVSLSAARERRRHARRCKAMSQGQRMVGKREWSRWRGGMMRQQTRRRTTRGRAAGTCLGEMYQDGGVDLRAARRGGRETQGCSCRQRARVCAMAAYTCAHATRTHTHTHHTADVQTPSEIKHVHGKQQGFRDPHPIGSCTGKSGRYCCSCAPPQSKKSSTSGILIPGPLAMKHGP